ncbi:CHAT domain-containing protein [Roseomonas sp. OT10]|uniref:CHAT domain-containing protein n=1 Tax=Roseomonas cutis TaxID=2897332 RepID=UPI001E29CC50|nr:CHAT domain-containing tetratricopeptide repeat protein [Roseomonas sp. OT10]UFN49512.1 CHAT domain-containing protein [Roseomonas sp. OT10]
MPRLTASLLLAPLLALGACNAPPPGAYVAPGEATSARRAEGEPAGQDARGGACLAQPAAAPPADLPVLRAREAFCGGWTQPAARVVELQGGSDAASLDALARGGLWRTQLDQRVTCGAPEATTLSGGAPARLLSCTRRVGGWPHVALVTAGPRGPVVADGLVTALPVMERLALGQGTGGGVSAGRSASAALAVRQLSASAFSADDVGRYEQLMELGTQLNQAENYASAEEAYRSALAVQERALGRDNPNTVQALMSLALNLSNQQRLRDAEQLFARADSLAPRAADTVAPARLLHYRGLHALNAGEPAEAEALLRRAETAYAAQVPDSLEGSAPLGDVTIAGTPSARAALIGLAEARRARAIAVARAGRPEEAPALAAESQRLLQRARLDSSGMLQGRGLRTLGSMDSRLGRDERATSQLEAAARRFNAAAPGERPEAVTLFLAGSRLLNEGRRDSALLAFRNGATVLRARQIALPAETVLPYLDALAAEAAAKPAEAAALRREMFVAAQLAQRGATVRFVQQASARLAAAGGNEAVGTAVRRLQDADQALRELYAQRDTLPPPGPGARNPTAAIDERIAEAQRLRAEAESEVAAAAPGYRQLLLTVTEAADAAAALSPGEVLVTMLLGRDHGHVLALRSGEVTTARTTLNEGEAQRLAQALRQGAAGPDGAAPGRFDGAPAHALYQALLAPLAPAMEGAQTLIVVPDGPLLAIPFGMLLTGPLDPSQPLAAAPWLVRRFAVAHSPSPQTLVTLRRAGSGSAAPLPYLGFGDFVPPTAAQLVRTFPSDRCANDARLAQGLGRLPGTRVEVQLAQETLGARPGSVTLGAAFTAQALRRADLGQTRILHLATHALLPGELSCLQEPSIVVSPPPGAADASKAFVPASKMLALKMDADLVILSACNTGGPGGAGGGEALSGLARAFFYAGARGLLATHWSVDDAASALTVADLLRRQKEGDSTAAALRGAQLLILDEAGKRLPESFGHPFYWAPFALIGDGRQGAPGWTARL